MSEPQKKDLSFAQFVKAMATHHSLSSSSEPEPVPKEVAEPKTTEEEAESEREPEPEAEAKREPKEVAEAEAKREPKEVAEPKTTEEEEEEEAEAQLYCQWGMGCFEFGRDPMYEGEYPLEDFIEPVKLVDHITSKEITVMLCYIHEEEAKTHSVLVHEDSDEISHYLFCSECNTPCSGLWAHLSGMPPHCGYSDYHMSF
jgi:hypothetical protein